MNDAKFYDIIYVIEFTISQFQSGSQLPREKKQNTTNKITKKIFLLSQEKWQCHMMINYCPMNLFLRVINHITTGWKSHKIFFLDVKVRYILNL